ncbi:(E3-independent) E2 ubiquitin-conjugating enzyme UBE2O isoform X2 [Xenopus laevis]|uniref:(E3-independent) E2 ubiquitin-conjugating enzyme n=1 Tax=Xenopus laevis TaxID=8355 RepID=A0A8J1LQT4_XENLA|nr:(E3-independent) E2 ubiquitin-conjugating enzyme UBE2O isoform X2 [Xenopus laevis]
MGSTMLPLLENLTASTTMDPNSMMMELYSFIHDWTLEHELELEDRSLVPRDVVRRMSKKDSQCGTVIDMNIDCLVKVLGTNLFLPRVNSKELYNIWPIMYGDYIAYDFWLGKVYDLKKQVVLKLSNGARCSMSTKDASKLCDVCPHASDSGLSFDDSYGFYPGQALIGPSKVFSRVQWLSGVKPVLSVKSKFRVGVEEVQVTELRVTWITKSLGGTDCMDPPPAVITQENLSRVKRLGSFDHTQRQLGERCLYIFPTKVEGTKNLCESFEKNCLLGEVTVTRKQVDKLREKQKVKIISRIASSTTSFQSGSGTGRKKSIPLSIRNLKRKHKKKKKSKVFIEFKHGDRVAVEIITTVTTADVMWQDGSVETNIQSNELVPIQHLYTNEFFPGDFVVDKRTRAAQDPSIYGVVQCGDHKGRTCVVKWIKLNSEGDDTEVVGEEENVSVYDIVDHPDFQFRATDIVICIGSSDPEAFPDARQPSVGQVACVDVSSKVEVIWADNSRTMVLPQHLYNVESELKKNFYVDSSSSGASSDEWEDMSDSWETDNGLKDSSSSGASSDEWEDMSNSWETDNGLTDSSSSGASSDELEYTSDSWETANGLTDSSSSSASSDKLEYTSESWETANGLTDSSSSGTSSDEWEDMSDSWETDNGLTDSSSSGASSDEWEDMSDSWETNNGLTEDVFPLAAGEEAAATQNENTPAEPLQEPVQDEPEQSAVRSEWPSDTLGTIFTSAKGEVISLLETAPESHAFKKLEFQAPKAKKFLSTVYKEMALLATSLPDGIMVKTFEDRMDLFSAFIKGPTHTPYEDGLFLFDMQLPSSYPAVPPLCRYLSQCRGNLNPNLYDNGKVCVSLLGTWIGKGTERWTSKSNLLQVLISIQGLILVNEPYYNEAGFDRDRGLQEGYENSRCYNEMALIRVVQSMTHLLRRPVEVFQVEICEHFKSNGWRLAHRIENWLETNSMVERGDKLTNGQEHPCIVPYSSTEPECTPDPTLDSKDLDDSGCGASTMSPGESQQLSDLQSTSKGAMGGVTLSEEPRGAAGGGQPSVKPKKHRKSYRSFLPDKLGFPDVGFPLFPLSKGFIKRIQRVLAQYKASLLEVGISEPRGGRLTLPL